MLRCKKCNIIYKEGKFCKKCGELLIKKETFTSFFIKFGAPLILITLIGLLITWAPYKAVKPPEITQELERKDRIEPSSPSLAIWLLTGGEKKITARLADKDEPHIAQLAKVFLAHDPKYDKLPMELLGQQIWIEDIFQGALMNKTSSDLSSEDGKQDFIRELADRVNAILSDGQIQTIYMEVIVQ